MAYKVIILYQLYMPSYFLGTFTEYPFIIEFLLGHIGVNCSSRTMLLKCICCLKSSGGIRIICIFTLLFFIIGNYCEFLLYFKLHAFSIGFGKL